MQDNNHSFSLQNSLKKIGQQVLDTVSKYSKLLLLVGCFGAVLGLAASFIKHPKFTSEITFLVEESKTGAGGLLSSLGSQIGIDVASMAGAGNSVISGDNMLELLKSKSMMQECLLTPFQNDSNYVLADRYVDVYNLRKKWANDADVNKEVFFKDSKTSRRLKDSLLSVIIKRIHKKEFSVTKPDKKLGFFKVATTTNDELLSEYLSERIIKIATDFYVNNKVGRLKNNVARLEHRTDSIGNLLNHKTYSAMNDARLMLNLNPADVNAQGSAEISQRDKMVLSTIYAELTKNLEISKTALVQETPTIQITDKPILPLERDEIKWYEGLLIGFFAPVLFLLIVLVI
ncbi:MAG: hypothetical protein RLZ56_1464 [Bacteroidota bacterium]